MDAAKEFTDEIDPASLTLENLIGAGINLLFYLCLMSLVNLLVRRRHRLLSAKLRHYPEIASSYVTYAWNKNGLKHVSPNYIIICEFEKFAGLCLCIYAS